MPDAALSPCPHGEEPRVYPWPVHPAAEAFPELTAAQLRELAADIGAHGLVEPACLYRDPAGSLTLLDGRSRVTACAMAGVVLRTRVYEGVDPVGYAASLNLHRRHLTTAQRAFAGQQVARLYAAEAAARKKEQEHDPVTGHFSSSEPVVANWQQPAETDWERKSIARAAAAVGSSPRGVARARRLADRAPDLAAQVKAGTKTLGAADAELRDRIARGSVPVKARTSRRPLPDFAERAGWELRRAVERIERIVADDRFPANRPKIAIQLGGHLQYTADTARDLLARLTETETETPDV